MQNPRYVLVTFIVLILLSPSCSPAQPIIDRLQTGQPATSTESVPKEQEVSTPLKVVSFSTPTPTAVLTNAIPSIITPVHTETSTTEPLSTNTPTPTNIPVPINTTPPTNTPVPTNIPTQVLPTATPPTKALPENSEPTLTPTVTPAPTSAVNPNSKRGIMLPAAYSFCQDIDTLKASWYYRNGTNPASDCPSPDPRFVPRLSNAKKVTNETLITAIENAKASGWLIGYTEPNLPWWDGHVTPQEGALAWRKIEEAVLPAGIKLVSPSPSQHKPGENDDYGYTWIWAMVDAYENEYGEKPHFDAVGWNYYDNNISAFQTFFSARHQEALARGYDIPFWILEYAGECWNTNKYPTGNNEIMTQMTPSLEETPWIARYVWFTNRIKPEDPWAPNWHSCTLINPDTGELTSLGQFYAAQ